MGKTLIFLFISVTLSHAGSVTIGWEANPETNVRGYKIYYKTNRSGAPYDGVGIFQGNSPVTVPIDKLQDPDNPVYTLLELDDAETYYFAITAYNDETESDYSNEVILSVHGKTDKTPLMETGILSIDHNWQTVELDREFIDPVVVANGLSLHGDDPSAIRIRNVAPDGFEIRVQEYQYLNDYHMVENASYIVMERGSYELDDGTRIEAGTFKTDMTKSFDIISFNHPFNKVPVLLTSIVSFNDADTVIGRVHGITTQNFGYRMQEQELNAEAHNTLESIGYIAWEPSAGNIGGILFEVDRTTSIVTHNLTDVHFRQLFDIPPAVVAGMQTCNGGNTANVRIGNVSDSAVNVMIDEEQSRDDEITHVGEAVGYMVLGLMNAANENFFMTPIDTDSEGISGADEFNIYGTDPEKADIYGDEPVSWQACWYSDDGDGFTNLLDMYSDADGLPDGSKINENTDPSDYEPNLLLLNIEHGILSIDNNWYPVELNREFIDPVVVANGLSLHGDDPSVIRIRNVAPDGFEIRVQEYPYLDGDHKLEEVSYIVMERGSYELDDGTRIEAGTFKTDMTKSFDITNFNQAFNKVPVLLTSIVSFNDADAVTGRVHGVTTQKFEYKMQEQELNAEAHNTLESIGYIAWEPSAGNIGGILFEVDKTANIVTHNLTDVHFRQLFDMPPAVVAGMQTCNGGNTANVRIGSVSDSIVNLMIDEEQSNDSEVWHIQEVVGYMAFKHR